MATGKKSFIAYADWKNIFDELPNEDAGALIKHIFSYVNDENPTTDSILIRAVFANIKSTLQRDLDKWESQLHQRSEAGKKSAESRRAKRNDRSTTVKFRARKSTDNVNVNVNVNTDTPPSFDFKKSLLSLGFDSILVDEWLRVRKAKKLTNTETALNKFVKQVELTGVDKNLILEKCVEKSWGGFESSWINSSTFSNAKEDVKILGVTADGEEVTDPLVFHVYKQMGKL